jgi:hypothetical protein
LWWTSLKEGIGGERRPKDRIKDKVTLRKTLLNVEILDTNLLDEFAKKKNPCLGRFYSNLAIL